MLPEVQSQPLDGPNYLREEQPCPADDTLLALLEVEGVDQRDQLRALTSLRRGVNELQRDNAGCKGLGSLLHLTMQTLSRVEAMAPRTSKIAIASEACKAAISQPDTCAIDRVGANLFFRLISRRYERGPMILTNNQSFGAWGEVFGDRMIATAIPGQAAASRRDAMNIRGNSYRDKLKAGLVRPRDDSSSQPGGEF